MVKTFNKVKVDDISSSPLICKPSRFISEGHAGGQMGFIFHKSTLNFP